MKTKRTRRKFLERSGSAALGLGVAGLVAPAIAAKTRTLTISTWGGDTEDAIKSFVMPKFEREHNAKLVFDSLQIRHARYYSSALAHLNSRRAASDTRPYVGSRVAGKRKVSPL